MHVYVEWSTYLDKSIITIKLFTYEQIYIY